MVEMCIAAPLMIALWIGVDYFRVGYARRLQTLSDVHAEAWRRAYSNDGSCFTSGAGPWQGFTGASQPIVDGNGNTVDPVALFSGTSSLFMYGTARASASSSVSNGRLGAKMTSEMMVTCDEVVPDATPHATNDRYADRNVVTPMWDFVKSFFRF